MLWDHRGGCDVDCSEDSTMIPLRRGHLCWVLKDEKEFAKRIRRASQTEGKPCAEADVQKVVKTQSGQNENVCCGKKREDW